MSEEDYNFLFKIVIVGDSGTGKSNIFTRFMQDEFNPESKATIGVEFSAKNVQIKDKIIKAQVWDTAGQERFRALAKSYYRGAVGALLVYDITNYESFKNVKKWLKEVRDFAEPHLTAMLIGNKTDLEETRAVKVEEGTELAQSEKLGFLETSAKSNSNIDEAFTKLVNEILERLEKEPPTNHKDRLKEKQTTNDANKNQFNANENIQISPNKNGAPANANGSNCAC